MSIATSVVIPSQSNSRDEEIVERVLAGDGPLFEILMRRHNQRIYRIVRSIVKDESEAEDVMQEAYVRAYQHLNQFEGRSTFITWLTRIAMNEAFVRAKRLNRQTSLDSDEVFLEMNSAPISGDNPENNVANGELRNALSNAILALPIRYRSVIMMRDVEEMSTSEAAALLQISETSLKVRLHRARAMVRRFLYEQSGRCASELFPFPASRCNRVVAAVLARIITI